jgi:RNA polymerase sigma factor (sigma-70 family)
VHPSLSDIESIYRHRGADFFRLAHARTGDRESARDAVQEGFANAIRGLRSYRAAGSLEAWVARCVINAARDSYRHERNPAGTDPQGDYATAVEDPSRDTEREAVRAAVAQLPRRQRDALFLRFYLDFDYAAIADVLGIEVGTVSATLHAARAGLTQTLQEV